MSALVKKPSQRIEMEGFYLFKLQLIAYMAPVAGTVTDTEENGLFFFFCFSKSFFSPGVPVYRVMGVLEEVRGFFIYKSIGY